MELKHTPGPWRVDPMYKQDVQTEDGKVEICGAEYEIEKFGEGYIVPKTLDEASANATLIAAAPEMLEALQYIMDRHSKHLDGFEFEYIHKIISKAIGAGKQC